MKLISWIITLCDRKWQKKFDYMRKVVESPELPELGINIVDIINSQPVHPSYRFRPRTKRQYSTQKPRTEVNKEKLMAGIIREELAKLAK